MKKSFEPYVNLSFIPSIETSDWSVGRAVLEALCSADHRLMPEKVGNSEPLKTAISSIEECAPYWARLDDVSRGGIEGNADSFMWKRSRAIKSTGHVMHRFRNKFGDVRPTWLIVRADPDRKVAWSDLFTALCGVLNPVYATLHIVGAAEQDSKNFSASSVESFGFDDHLTGLPPINLKRKGLANLSWLNYFGHDLQSLLDVPALTSAGFATTIGEKGVMLQLTSNIFDVIDNFRDFSSRREQLRKIFAPAVFRVNDEPKLP
ncbi:MAG: hypothetical protein EOP37_23735 [Rubrivivax sp.]|nr:MAG: hypothetical protein EOP37_23735 [Rubrivivax sp.]